MHRIHLFSDRVLPECFGVNQSKAKGLVYASTEDAGRARLWFDDGVKSSQGFYALVPDQFKPGALFFDMDATFVEEETLVEIAQLCGSFDQVSEITKRAMAGELDFEQALRQRVATLKGHSATHLGTVRDQLKLTPGLMDLLRLGSDRGWPIFLVSGGFVQLAAPLAQQLRLTNYAANDLGTQDGKFTGTLNGTIVDARFKKDWLVAMCEKHQIQVNQAVAIGDGANDADMMQAAGLAVGFRPKAILFPLLNICNHTGDHGLTAVVLDHFHK